MHSLGVSQTFTPKLFPDSLRQAKYFHLPASEPLDQIMIQDQLQTKIDSLRDQGYLAVSIDSTRIVENHFQIYAFLGEQYHINEIENGNVEEEIYQLYFKNQTTLNWPAVAKKRKEVVQHYVNQGFINAKAKLNDFQFKKEDISAKLFVNQGQQYVLDSIAIIGNLEIRQSYLLSTLELEKGAVLNRAFFQKLNQQVATSTFIKMEGEPSFRLKEDGKAIVYLPLNEKAANEFDLLLGFLPNPNPRLSDKKLLLTGEGRLQLYNPFGAGREFFVDYKQLQPESPKLEANLFFPQFLKTDFGIVGAFNLFKQDTSFVNVDGSFGLRYDFKGNKELSIKYHRARSYLQNIDTNYVKQNRRLPTSVDFNQNLYKAEFRWLNTNKLRNPSRGFVVKAGAGVGNREITKNTSITRLQDPTFNFESLYTGLNDNKLLLVGNIEAQYFLPLFKRSAFLLQSNTGTKQLNHFFENDLHRLGGYKSIRGFDEQSYLASTYTINTAEYRLLLNEDSFFSVFTDMAWLNNQMNDKKNQLIGLGSGLDLATNAGIFSLNLAIGQDDNTSFDFNKTRLHIGYVNVF